MQTHRQTDLKNRVPFVVALELAFILIALYHQWLTESFTKDHITSCQF